MRIPFMLFAVFFAVLSVIFSCNPDPPAAESDSQVYSPQKVKEQFMKANQLQIQKESDEMDVYERTHHLQFKKTGSGVRYLVYKPSANGDSIRKGMFIHLKYTVFLLDGSPCYSSEEDGTKQLVVEQEPIESGIHIGLQYLKKGDKALFLIPSHLAHGLLGDFKKIPPQMPIVYDVEVY